MTSITSDVTLAAKFRGCMIGSLVGDCLGRPFEGNVELPHRDVSREHLRNFLSNILNGESEKIYPYTDDTAMTISVAKSLVETRKICPKNMAKRFVTEFFSQPNRGYCMTVSQVFEELKDSKFQDVFGPAKLRFFGAGSYGNGAAMRIAPIALFAHAENEEYIKNAVEQCSCVTHTHAYGYNGAILQCLAVHAALKLDPSKDLDPMEFVSELENKMKNIETNGDTPYCNSLKKIKEYLQDEQDMSSLEIAKNLGNEIAAQRSVPTAIYAFLRGLHPISEYECLNPFVRTIYFAISVGGDTDTIASMAGSIAGAYHGEDVIPETMQERCELIDDVGKLAHKLFAVSIKDSKPSDCSLFLQ